MRTVKCRFCNTEQETSFDGWLQDTWPKDPRTGLKYHEVKYVRWAHVVGHLTPFGKFCKGSGESPALYRP